MKKKKVYQSQSLKILNKLEKLIWCIPIVFFFLFYLKTSDIRRQVLEHDDSLPVVIAIFCICAFVAVLQSIPFFLVSFFYVRSAKKRVIRNSTFIAIEDFEYYRDKLNGLSPGEISLIADLKIEARKDIAASILKYKQMGILTETDGVYKRNPQGEFYLKKDALRKSDNYLLEKLEQGHQGIEYDFRWQQLIEEEAIEDGYIIQKGKHEKKGSLGCFTALFPVVLLAILIVMTVSFKGRLEPLMEVLERAPSEASLGVQLSYLKEYPEFYPLIAEMFLYLIVFVLFLCSPWAVIGALAGGNASLKWLFVFFFCPLIAIVGGLLERKSDVKEYKRTNLGNEMAECIYGMKNFIHDYSNLSEAHQEQVVLWDDYLVYAVVLEENQKIIADIMNRRKKGMGA